MEKRRSLAQYRSVDLFLWAVMLLLFEGIILTASLRWFPAQPYTVSLVPVITAVVLVRWGSWAAIHAVLGGILVCRLSGATVPQYAIYCVGNLLSLALLPWLSRWRKEKGLFSEALPALGFGLCVLFLMQLGRALMAIIFGGSLPVALGCFTTEAVTDLFTLVILWIVRRLDGVLEDQRHYLFRMQKEEKKQTRF